MYRFITMIVLAAAFAATTAMAQHTRDYSDELPDDLPPFDEVDKDDDGLIDREEPNKVGIPREVFEAGQRGGFLAEPTYRCALRRENP